MALFPRFHQLGYVVRDLDAALAWWTGTLGVGPFFVSPAFVPEGFVFRGVASSPRMTLALAQWGDQQIELIQQHDGAASAYAECAARGGGLQHLAYWSDDIVRDRAICERRGLTVQQEGALPGGDGTKFYYYEGGDWPGATVELITMTDAKRRRFAAIARAAADWDGGRPVRPLADAG